MRHYRCNNCQQLDFLSACVCLCQLMLDVMGPMSCHPSVHANFNQAVCHHGAQPTRLNQCICCRQCNWVMLLPTLYASGGGLICWYAYPMPWDPYTKIPPPPPTRTR
jgi:hypothetical protein